MALFFKFWSLPCKLRCQTPNRSAEFARYLHSGRKPVDHYSSSVAVLWDLDNKPPKSLPPYQVAVKLKAAAACFGPVRHNLAYGDEQTFSNLPHLEMEQRRSRKILNALGSKGAMRSVEPYICRVCGRKFYIKEKFVNHFKQIHETEHRKRMNEIENAQGSRRVMLVGKYAMKLHKYRNALKDLTVDEGSTLGDELKRAGFKVRTVTGEPGEAGLALRNDVVEIVDGRRAECLVFVSKNPGFVNVLREAKMRGVRIVSVGDVKEGALKTHADAWFSWGDVVMGKVKKEAASVVGKWRDRDVLKNLEWRYDPHLDGDLDVDEGSVSEEICDDVQNDDKGFWLDVVFSSDSDT